MDEVRVVWDTYYWLAFTDDPPIHGVGRSPDAARKDYDYALKELRRDLEEAADESLSKYFRSLKRKLLTPVKEKVV
jgi:hypothetical protein